LYRAVVLHREERRLLDQHMLAGLERLQGEMQVKAGRRGDDDGLDPRVREGGFVRGIAADAAEPRAVIRRLRLVAARIAARGRRAERPELAAVHGGDEATAEEGDVQGCGHREGRARARRPGVSGLRGSGSDYSRLRLS